MLMANLQANLRARLPVESNLATLAEQLDLDVENTTPPETYVTLFMGVLDRQRNVLRCVNAGHNLPLWYHAASGTHEFLPRGGRALGWFDDLPVNTVEVQFEPGDVLVLYTDGVSEAENLARDYFGEDRLVEVVKRTAGQSAKAVLDEINTAVDIFVGDAPPFDDHTLVIVRYVG